MRGGGVVEGDAQIMEDKELISYCVAQCRTPVGAIHRDMMLRLHKLAEESDDETMTALNRVDWWHPTPEWIDSLAVAARNRLIA